MTLSVDELIQFFSYKCTTKGNIENYNNKREKTKHMNNMNIPVGVRIVVGLALVIVAHQVLLKRPQASEFKRKKFYIHIDTCV